MELFPCIIPSQFKKLKSQISSDNKNDMATKKVLVVFGATGNQGGSVIKTILDDPKMACQFELRAITRDPSKPVATSLTEEGIIVLKVCFLVLQNLILLT
jgi:hypothetical protein